MSFPQPEDYIDIHTHDSKAQSGVYIIENLMAHEGRKPDDLPEYPCTYGIHPWFLNAGNIDYLLNCVQSVTGCRNLIAIGETGFDKLRGPSLDLQLRAFEKQILISEEIRKPVIIHCVRAWDELLPAYKKLKPKMPWLIHGFRGNVKMAEQLLSKGMYLSFWFDFVVRPESSDLLRRLPRDRIFLETDGADVKISSIYNKVSNDLNLTVEELKLTIRDNFISFFSLSQMP